jgi:predicted MFS family arabinose efflux permease
LVLLTFMDEERSRAALPPTATSVRESLLAGLRYVAATPRVYVPLGVLGTLGVFGISFQTIAPVYALETLGLDERGYGLLVAAMGIGALLAAIPMTLVTLGLARRILYTAPIAFGVILGALALNTWPPLAFVLVAPLGFCFLLTNSSVNVTIQGTVPHEVRGRTMGIYMSVMHGGSAIGALVMGTLAEAFDVQVAMVVGAVATLLAVVGLRLRGMAEGGSAQNAPIEARVAGPEV